MQTEGQADRDRHADRGTDRQRQARRERDRKRETGTQTEGHTDRDDETQRDRETEGERQKESEKDREREGETKTQRQRHREGDRQGDTRCKGKAGPRHRGLGPMGGGEGGPRPGRGAGSQAGKVTIHSLGDTGHGVWMWGAEATS